MRQALKKKVAVLSLGRSSTDAVGRSSADATVPNPDSSAGPAEPPPSGSPEYGVEVLYDPPGATVDICFVHGLTGNRRITWTHPTEAEPWPKTLLPGPLPTARVLTYGYNAYVVEKAAAETWRPIDHARSLLNDLTNHRLSAGALDRPLIFVAHSLGGLLCKKALLDSRDAEPHLRRVFQSLKGVIFLGTPHRGAWMARWAGIPARALGVLKTTNRSLLDILNTNSELLDDIHNRFLLMIRDEREGGRPVRLTCFWEAKPMLRWVVVEKESASLEGYSAYGIGADHRDMVRFQSPDDPNFQRVLGELLRWEGELRSKPVTSPQLCELTPLPFSEIWRS